MAWRSQIEGGKLQRVNANLEKWLICGQPGRRTINVKRMEPPERTLNTTSRYFSLSEIYLLASNLRLIRGVLLSTWELHLPHL
jgi:hypothetical protein